MGVEEGRVDVDEGQFGVGIVVDDVQALEARDARQRDVCLARANRFLRRVHETVYRASLRGEKGCGTSEHERVLAVD